MKAYIGIDNGVSGSLALVLPGCAEFRKMPIHKEQSYTKVKAQITRVDWMELDIILASWCSRGYDSFRAFIERPYVNPKGFKATVSALRCLEATLISVERVRLSYEYVDSRQWQKILLPKGCKGPDLKTASTDIGCRLFPEHSVAIKKHKDADSLLIAEWARREGL